MASIQVDWVKEKDITETQTKMCEVSWGRDKQKNKVVLDFVYSDNMKSVTDITLTLHTDATLNLTDGEIERIKDALDNARMHRSIALDSMNIVSEGNPVILLVRHVKKEGIKRRQTSKETTKAMSKSHLKKTKKKSKSKK